MDRARGTQEENEKCIRSLVQKMKALKKRRWQNNIKYYSAVTIKLTQDKVRIVASCFKHRYDHTGSLEGVCYIN